MNPRSEVEAVLFSPEVNAKVSLLATEMAHTAPAKWRAPVVALKGLLLELLFDNDKDRALYDVHLYGDLDVINEGRPDERVAVRLAEVDLVLKTHRGGFSYMQEPDALATLRACEDVIRTGLTEPYRPKGWQSDIDEREDARWRLRQVIRKDNIKPDAPPPVGPQANAIKVYADDTGLVRIIVSGLGAGKNCEMHYIANDDRMRLDAVDEEGNNSGTSSQTHQEAYDALVAKEAKEKKQAELECRALYLLEHIYIVYRDDPDDTVSALMDKDREVIGGKAYTLAERIAAVMKDAGTTGELKPEHKV